MLGKVEIKLPDASLCYLAMIPVSTRIVRLHQPDFIIRAFRPGIYRIFDTIQKSER